MSILLFLTFNIDIAIIIIIGNIALYPRPILRDSPEVIPFVICIVIKLINQGPNVHPLSPERASTLYIAPPPFGKSLAARLSVAGHMILTVIPVNAQVKSEIEELFIKQVPR